MNTDIKKKLDYSEIWIRDMISSAKHGDFFQSIEVDMVSIKNLIDHARKNDIRMTYTHAFVRATAIALSIYPEVHQLVCGKKKVIPGQVDIGLSVASDSALAPVMIIENSGQKTIKEISIEIDERAQIVSNDNSLVTTLRKWGWLVPFGFLRRFIFRTINNGIKSRRQSVGSFQITCLRDINLFVPFLFSTAAIIATSEVCDKVIAVDGKPEVRPVCVITCCADHRVLNGSQVAAFLGKIKEILQSDKLRNEF